MLILTLRTDKPEAEIGLFNDEAKLGYLTWQAHRQLAETIHLKIKDLLDSQNKDLKDLRGIIAFRGPGSFTGLRVGLSVANALADSLRIPIVGALGEAWLKNGIELLLKGGNSTLILPEYGAPVNITLPKK